MEGEPLTPAVLQEPGALEMHFQPIVMPTTGYAGLQQLMRVRPDIVKLDRSLVNGVAHDPRRAALLASFDSFATQTGGAVCAEGLEDPADLRVVAARVHARALPLASLLSGGGLTVAEGA
ncbi:MAG: hypothetical protein QOK49_2236 [Baekduia sp.]|nr:hypothetical protein [Baekduia sp.]